MSNYINKDAIVRNLVLNEAVCSTETLTVFAALQFSYIKAVYIKEADLLLIDRGILVWVSPRSEIDSRNDNRGKPLIFRSITSNRHRKSQ